MAATVSAATFGARQFPERHANMGPFISSAGNVYALIRGGGSGSGLEGALSCMKATDPMTSFALAGGASKVMSSATTTMLQAAGAYQVGDVVHVVTQISTGACYYNSFNMATDAWTLATSETAVAAASQAPVTDTTYVDLVVRSGGEVVIVYNAGQTAMSSTFNMVRYRRRTGTNTYQTAVNVDNGGSVNWLGGVCALGASDRVHFFFRDNTSADFYQRTLSAANALQTFPATFDANGDVGTYVGVFSNTLSYDDAGTQRIRALYGRVGPFASLVKLDSADAPTVTTETNIGDNAAKLVNNQDVMALGADGTTLHALYSHGSNSDLYHDSSTGGGGAWGTDVNELTATINHISTNVYTRSGTTYLAMVLDDAGTIKYAEITLAAAVTASLIWPTETSYRILSRR